MFDWLRKPRKECEVPPPGWRCTRGAGHEPPCAAIPAEMPIEHNAINLSGMELERAVQRELLRGDPGWEIANMQSLLTIIWAHGWTVVMQTYMNGRTMVAIRPGDILSTNDNFVSEESDSSPCVALARAALSAIRTWPEVT